MGRKADTLACVSYGAAVTARRCDRHHGDEQRASMSALSSFRAAAETEVWPDPNSSGEGMHALTMISPARV